MYQDPTDEDIERSTNHDMLAGVVLLALMVLVFPLYRFYEPAARDDARDAQAASLAEKGERSLRDTTRTVDGWGVVRGEYRYRTLTDDADKIVSHIGILGSELRNGSGVASWAYGAAHVFQYYP